MKGTIDSFSVVASIQDMSRIEIRHIDAKSEGKEKSDICEKILLDLPQWFGVEEATRGYIAGVADKPMFVASIAGDAMGFLSTVCHFAETAEIYVIGVARRHHRQGAGSLLVASVLESLRDTGTEFLMVKTLGPSHPDQGYAKTRSFYEKAGFRPLEEISEVWGAENPCLIMVRTIQ